MRLASLFPAAAVLAAPLALAACSPRSDAPSAEGAEVRLNANPDAPAAGYMVLRGGAQPVKLLRVVAQQAERVEMHESVMDKGLMRMKALDSVAVPAGGEVKFAQGGKHLMLFGIAPAAVKAGKLGLTLLFSDGRRLTIDAAVKPAGAGAPGTPAMAPMDHGAMNHAAMPHEGGEAMEHAPMDHSTMDHSTMNHAAMDHTSMDHASMSGAGAR